MLLIVVGEIRREDFRGGWGRGGGLGRGFEEGGTEGGVGRVWGLRGVSAWGIGGLCC